MNYKLSVVQMKSKSKPIIVSGLLLANYFVLVLQLSPCCLIRSPRRIAFNRDSCFVFVFHRNLRNFFLEESRWDPKKQRPRTIHWTIAKTRESCYLSQVQSTLIRSSSLLALSTVISVGTAFRSTTIIAITYSTVSDEITFTSLFSSSQFYLFTWSCTSYCCFISLSATLPTIPAKIW